jgi:hypothetical protein
MLPDLPNLKQDIRRIQDRHLENRIDQQSGFFSELPKHYMHEGNRMRIRRANGSVEEIKRKKTLGKLSLNVSEIPALTLKERIAKLDTVADQMADQMVTHTIETLGEGLDKAGQVIDRKGKPFDAETIFEVLEKIQIEFDKSEQYDLTILIPPALAPRVKEILQLLETDKNLQKRHAEIMERKREEWRDREAARKLVG